MIYLFTFEETQCMGVSLQPLLIHKLYVGCFLHVTAMWVIFFGGHTVVGLTYSLLRFIENWPIDNELRWIKWNPVGRQTSPNTIPTDPKRIFLFISNMLWARRKDLVQSALGFCSVQGVIFSSFVYSHFLDITKRTFFPNEAWKLIVSCQEGSF